MTHHLLQEHADLATAIEILDKWTAHNLREKQLPGMALGLVYRDELLWGKGYGYADLESGAPITLDTRFRIASISKTFTATGILQLRDAGKLKLDDPVSLYLDWFDLRYRQAPQITIRNLLTHTAGLPRDSVKAMWTDCEAPGWDDFIAQTRSRQPTRAPYEHYAYSNLGYALLGGIIAVVSGQTWASYLQRQVLDPLEMTETYPAPEADDARLATGYTRAKPDGQRAAFPFWKMNAFEASANFAAPVKDLVKYAAFHLGLTGDAVLSPYTLRDMHRVHWLDESWAGGYGLGMGLHRVQDWVISGHGGGYPGYLTAFTICREHQAGVIALCNALGSNPHQVAEQAYKLVLPELQKATAEAPPAAKPAWSKFVGDYASEWAVQKVVIRAGQLQLLTLDNLNEKPTILEATDDETVFVLRQAGQSNETLRFELDTQGQVARMWERNEYSARIN